MTLDELLKEIIKVQRDIDEWRDYNYDGSHVGDMTPFQALSELSMCIDNQIYQTEKAAYDIARKSLKDKIIKEYSEKHLTFQD